MFATSPSGAPAGSRRYWITVICFVIANAAVWGAFRGWDYWRRPPLLCVERFEPKEGSVVGARPVFTWHFNLDLAPQGSDAPGLITPAVPGHWSRPTARTLVFTPDADLPKATRFTLTLPDQRIRSRDGYALDKTFTATVHTAELQWLGLRQAGIEPSGQMIIELEFSDAVLAADVAKRLTLKQNQTEEPSRPVRYDIFGAASGNIVRLRTEPVFPHSLAKTSSFTVHLDAGLCGAGGPLAMTQAEQRDLVLSTTVIATRAYGMCNSSGDAEIHLEFNNSIEQANLSQVLSVEPATAYHLSCGNGYWQLIGPFLPGTRYAVKLAPPPVAGDARFPLADTLSVLMPDVTPRVWFEQTDGYLGSSGNRTLLAHAVNVGDVKISVTRVYDNNLVIWRTAARHGYNANTDYYARPLAERPIHLPQTRNKAQDIRIDLDDLLPKDAARDGVYRVAINRGQNEGADAEYEYDCSDTSALVTLSDLGLSVKQTPDGLVAWVVSLSTGKPFGEVRLRLYSTKNHLLGEAKSDADGLARITAIHPQPGEEAAVVLADIGPNADALTWLDLRSSRLDLGDADVAGTPYLRHGFEAFLYTDRGVYRPGETVHLRGIVRSGDNATPNAFPVRWLLVRPDGHPWKSQVVQLDSDGSAPLDIELPADLPIGRWTAQLGLPGKGETLGEKYGQATFQIEEFIPNRMRIALELASGSQTPTPDNRLSTLRGKLTARVQGDYLFGKPAAECSATLVATAEPAMFSSPKWAGWTFGDSAETRETLTGTAHVDGRLELPQATLDSHGKARWKIDADKLFDVKGGGVGPWRVQFSASVIETGGRAVSASQGVQVDTIAHYVGLQIGNASVQPHQLATAQIALVAPDGSAAAEHATLEVNLYRETWNNSLVRERGRYRYQSTRRLESVQSPRIISLDGGKGQVSFTPPDEGVFVLSLRNTQTGDVVSGRVYASAYAWNDTVSREHPERLELVVLRSNGFKWSDVWKAARTRDGTALWQFAQRALAVEPAAPADSSPRFHVGDEAQILVRSPFAGELLLSVETDGVVSTHVIAMGGSQVSIPIQITDACRPGAYVTATVLRKIDPAAKWATHRAFGVARLNLDPSDRRLNVELAAPDELRPGQSLSVDIRLTDPAGRPAANAPVTLAAVDEGICDLTHFRTPDPLAFFTSRRALGVRWFDIYDQLMPEVARPDKQSVVGGDGSGKDDDIDAGHMTPVVARRVKSVSLVSPVLHTDANGIAHADFSLPEFVGQLRLMAVAYGTREFGCQKREVFVRSPLLVQSSWPRFAAPGDSFAVPLTVFNNSSANGTVQINIEWLDDDGPLAFAGKPGRAMALAPLPISAGKQAVASFNVLALQRIGVAHALLHAVMGSESFEEHVELPVRPAGPRIAVGSYATVSPATPMKIDVPENLLAGTFNLQIQASQRPVLDLPRGLDYLDHYPYGCCEQTTSGCFPLVYLHDIGKEIAPDVFTNQHVNLRVQAGILHLLSMQTEGGGIAMWPGERRPWPWGSVYAAHFLVQAKAAGFEVPRDFYDTVLGYVQHQIANGDGTADDIEVNCYGCYVLALAGKADQAAINHLAQILDAPPLHGETALCQERPQARFHLAAAYLAMGRRDLAAHLIPHVLPQARTQRQLANNIGSPVRDRAILLDTLLSVAPDHPEIPGLVQQIADAGAHNRWLSTQDTAFAVMALGHYLRQAKAEAPYETVELLAGTTVLAHSSDGKALAWSATTRPAGELSVRITGNANSRAHVSCLASGFALQNPPNTDAGMQIRRRYLDSHGQPLGAILHSGDLVQVELTLQSSTTLSHVVIDDLLPAGLEIENPRLETTADANHVAQTYPKDEPTFAVQTCDMRDDRLILVGDLPRAGNAHYLYIARAVTAGTFVVGPVQAQCMYDIGTQSLSGGGKTLRVLGMDKSPWVNIRDEP